MTGAVEVEEEEDASAELLAASIILALLMLRFGAGLRRLTAEHTADLQKRILVSVTQAGTITRRGAAGLADEVDALVAAAYARIYRDLLAELEGAAWAVAQYQTRQIDKVVGVPVAVPVQRSGLGEAVATGLLAGAALGAWLGKMGGDLSFRLGRVITDGARNGAGPTEVQQGIRDAVATAGRSLDTIVSTATTSAQAVATEAVIDANAGVTIQGTLWVSVLDGRTTPECRSRASLKWDSDRRPVGHTKAYREPPIHPNCRSSLIPWLMSADDMPVAIRRSLEASGKSGRLTGKAPKEPSLDEFLRSRSEAEQQQILGKAQWELWRKGKITQAGLLDQSSRPLTLAQLRRLLGLD